MSRPSPTRRLPQPAIVPGMPDETDLNVAVTGPTGTFGYALMPVLEAEARVKRVVGVARRPFNPALQGWAKMEYRQGDVRDRDGPVSYTHLRAHETVLDL